MMKAMNEFARIKAFLAPLAEAQGAFGLTDDAAVITPPINTQLVFTKDAMVEGVHFVGDENPAALAQKLLAVNLSDLAAMGAEPYAYLLATCLPKGVNESWLQAFTAGLCAAQKAYGITLFGGDSTASLGGITLSLTAIGTLPADVAPLRRNGAREGDVVAVSGTLGDAAVGLQIKQNKLSSTDDAAREYFIRRYEMPEPELALGKALRGVASACMDVSDGLLQDAEHMAQCSGVAMELEADALPMSEHLSALNVSRETALTLAATGGDDYRLLFTLPESVVPQIQSRFPNIAVIGRVKAGDAQVTLAGAPEFKSKGYQHF